MELLIWTENRGPRVGYVFSRVISRWVGLSVVFADSKAEWAIYTGPKIWYAAGPPPENTGIWLPASGFLSESGIRDFRPAAASFDGEPALFPLNISGTLFPFDLPAMIFYLLSRYEEYLPFEPDLHGRFPASRSLAAHFGFLQIPVVDLWLGRLLENLRRLYPSAGWKPPEGTVRVTYDVDMPWAYLHRKPWQYPGGYLRDLVKRDGAGLLRRLRVHLGLENDPFFTFQVLKTLHRQAGIRPTYFFLLAGPGKYDPYSAYRSAAYQGFAHALYRDFPCGIHPSYHALRPGVLERELARWQTIFGEFPARSRQHFLRLRLPDTYRRLISAGIPEDHSMGYADQPGFRAGTSRPFTWYDLSAEQTTTLEIFPFCVMEVTLKQYLACSPEAATDRLAELRAAVKKVDGDWAVLWHNSSLPPAAGWEGWDEVHAEMLKLSASF